MSGKIKFFSLNIQAYKEFIKYDYDFNVAFRGSKGKLSKQDLKGYEWKYIKCYRMYQANVNNLWGKLFRRKLYKLSLKTGIDFANNCNIGKGLIIGHWGKIVLNKDVKFGNQVMLTHGVTIGRDVRGKRKGVPCIGSRVCIRVNSTIVGNITIGDDVLIAPNTFVNFDVPDHSVVVGNPASVHHKENATEGHLPQL